MSGSILGIAANRTETRALAAAGQVSSTSIEFERCESVSKAGVLLLIPFLQESGLLSYQRHYDELSSGYYYMDVIVLFLALMYLCRIKNVEQLRQYSPGESGNLVGLDRIPEAKCFREKIRQIVDQERTDQWMDDLTRDWINKEEPDFYYIDGHVQVYHGYKAILGKKHVSGQRLCLPGIQEFWVNDKEGLPYFYVTGQVNEKLQEMLATHIVPRLIELNADKYEKQNTQTDALTPIFTIGHL